MALVNTPNGPFPFSVQQAWLLHHHPELTGYVPQLLGTYISCQKKDPSGLEQAYDHVRECGWCKVEFQVRREFKDSFR
jgi:hypothetical protein